MIKISNFKNKKLIEYLINDEPQSVLIVFIHGLGDTLMFYPVYEHLKNMFPTIKIDLYTESGQEEWFGQYNKEDLSYDYIFNIDFPCSEHIRPYITKADYCCQQELGIDYKSIIKQDVYQIPKIASPLIGVHFNSTCFPDTLNCNKNHANIIWNKIKEFGFIPIETHFEHMYNNPKNKKYDFVDNHVRGNKPQISKLFGLLQACTGFIGVVSGNLHAAMGIYPERVLYLKNEFDNASFYNNCRPMSLNLNNFDVTILERFLKTIKEAN